MASVIDLLGEGKVQEGDVAANWLRAASMPWDVLKQSISGTGSPAESLLQGLGVGMPQSEPLPFDQQMLDIVTASAPLAGIFAGRGSMNFPMAGLKEAKKMMRRVPSMEDKRLTASRIPTNQPLSFKEARAENIRQKTGWFQGLDDPKWRYEIDDSKMKIKESTLRKLRGKSKARSDAKNSIKLMEKKLKPYDTYVSLQPDGEVYIYGADGLSRNLFDTDMPFEEAMSVMTTAKHIERGLKPAIVPLADLIHHPELFKAYPWAKEIKVRPKKGAGASWSADDLSIKMGTGGNIRESIIHEVQHAVQDYEGFPRGGNVAEFLDSISVDDVIAAERRYLNLAGEREARLAASRRGMPSHMREGIPPYEGMKPGGEVRY